MLYHDHGLGVRISSMIAGLYKEHHKLSLRVVNLTRTGDVWVWRKKAQAGNCKRV